MYRYYLPVFRKDDHLILTSFKVMYSFLKSQTSLQQIFWNKQTLSIALSNRFLGHPKGTLLFRDPETRFLSYFNDKFRKTPRYLLAQNQLSPNYLQHCQRLWLDSVGADINDVETCCQTLLETPLESVLMWIHTTYHRDPHTLSQLDCLYAQRRWMKLRLDIGNIFLIDSWEEMQQFGQLLGLDTSQKVHPTEGAQPQDRLTQTGRDILRHLYASDFSTYQQIGQTPPAERSAVLSSVLKTRERLN